ncbi:MAG: hypothetical protein IIV94_00660 [Clostridiales bacterium]|jgi:hypothetical protein|nr:hypothetical protein [Clostridiales bacterium]
MSTELATIIVGALSLIGTLAGSFGGMKLMSYRIEQLERKVDKQADIAERVPIIEEQMKVVNHRLSDTERLIEGLRDKGA